MESDDSDIEIISPQPDGAAGGTNVIMIPTTKQKDWEVHEDEVEVNNNNPEGKTTNPVLKMNFRQNLDSDSSVEVQDDEISKVQVPKTDSDDSPETTPEFIRVEPNYPNDVRPTYTKSECGRFVRFHGFFGETPERDGAGANPTVDSSVKVQDDEILEVQVPKTEAQVATEAQAPGYLPEEYCYLCPNCGECFLTEEDLFDHVDIPNPCPEEDASGTTENEVTEVTQNPIPTVEQGVTPK